MLWTIFAREYLQYEMKNYKIEKNWFASSVGWKLGYSIINEKDLWKLRHKAFKRINTRGPTTSRKKFDKFGRKGSNAYPSK